MSETRAAYTTTPTSELAALRRFAEIILAKVDDHPAVKHPKHHPGGVLVEIMIPLTVGEIEILRKMLGQ